MTKIPAKARKNNCYKCGKLNKGTIRKLTTSEDSATEMLTRKLYQLLPEEKKKQKTEQVSSIWGNSIEQEEIANGRKLLVFSDNRQDAAKFAIFIQNLQRYIQNGNKLSYSTIYDDIPLGRQCRYYKQLYKQNKLPEERYQQILELGIDLAKEGNLM